MKNPKKTKKVDRHQIMKGPNSLCDWRAVDYKGFQIILNADDTSDTTILKAQEACDLHKFSSQKGNKVSQVYYLRGWRHKAAYDKVLIGAYEAGIPMPLVLTKIFENITFWNQEGTACYESNFRGNEFYPEFILRCIAADSKAFVEAYPQYISGRSGDHVWVSDTATGTRLIIIHF